MIDAVGDGVDVARVDERVWLWLAAHQRPGGTAEEYVVLPAVRAVPLPDGTSFELGASLGVPFVTAHRTLSVHEDGPRRLEPGALAGRSVLVAGGAGAVGNAAIQLARWAGATVLTTVSSPEKAALTTAAGAQHLINYRSQDVVAEVRRVVPGGVDIVAEVSPASNAGIDVDVLAPHGVVAAYAGTAGDEVAVPVRPLMALNARWQYVLLYTMPDAARADAIAAVNGRRGGRSARRGRACGAAAAPVPARADRRRARRRRSRRDRQGAHRDRLRRRRLRRRLLRLLRSAQRVLEHQEAHAGEQQHEQRDRDHDDGVEEPVGVTWPQLAPHDAARGVVPRAPRRTVRSAERERAGHAFRSTSAAAPWLRRARDRNRTVIAAFWPPVRAFTLGPPRPMSWPCAGEAALLVAWPNSMPYGSPTPISPESRSRSTSRRRGVRPAAPAG